MVLKVRMAERANLNRPVRADLLLIYDSTLLEIVTALPATAWFEKRAQIISDNIGKLDVFSWEWVPGQAVPAQAIPVSESIAATVFFADYDSPAEHRVNLNHLENTLLKFGERGFEAKPIQ
jgi:type VI secretion system protein